ncbi:MAG: phosphate/phosphite/phosphonate ABC transporter substrate-binding protein [Desulfobulbaceae bacterium]|mgnify:CR=1 FL=1|nr:MAG: phosphate/phosphite/phosphonate ABC transporter substrate-binding protein [Desulfobulbaceae bacterium]
MNGSGVFFIRVTVLITMLLISYPQSASAVSSKRNDPLYFSLIPKKDIDQQLKELRPLFQLLEKNMNRPIKIIRPKSYQSVIEGVLSRTIDFAILGPASYAKARLRDPEVEPFACFSSEKGYITPAGTYYHSVLFAVDDSGIDQAEDLRGKKVAFTDPASTSGSVIPNLYFPKETGFPMDGFFSTMVYTGSHDRAIKAVINTQVDAAFVSSSRLDEAIQNGVLEPKDVSILWKSKAIHSDPFVFRGGLPTYTKMQIKDAILSSSPEMSKILDDMRAIGIEAVSDQDYQIIHEIVSLESK